MEAKKKKGTPHTLVIIVILIFLATAATYIIPAGEFTRYEDPVSGETLVQAGSYVSTGTNPANPLHMPMLMYDGILDAADVIGFLLIIGGSFELVNASGSILALCRTVGRHLKGKEIFVVPIFLALFAVFGTTMGMSNEVAIFVPIGITMALTLGLDKVTGMAMVTVGAVTGFTAGLMNPFTVGVAQDIAGVPLFFGMSLRGVLLIAMLVIDTIYIIAYDRRVKKHPEKSILAGLFLAMGIVCGLIGGLSPSKIATTFTAGAKGLAGSALTLGFARAIMLTLENAMVIDTIANAVSIAVNALPAAVQSIGFFLPRRA